MGTRAGARAHLEQEPSAAHSTAALQVPVEVTGGEPHPLAHAHYAATSRLQLPKSRAPVPTHHHLQPHQTSF